MSSENTIPPASRSLPYGIAERHVDRTGADRIRLALILLLLGVPLLAAMFGVLGGGVPRVVEARSPQARVSVETPHVLRSGNWFETQVVVEPIVDIADLTIALDQPLWRRMSIDTMVPDPEKAQATGGRFAYSFGKVAAGERFVFKVDGQIQPYGLRRMRGNLTVRDGPRALVSVPVSLLVLP